MILIDDYLLLKKIAGCRRTAKWSHLTATTREELHAFAMQLGLRRDWFQDKHDGRWHYDVTSTVRQRAIACGAKPVSVRELSAFIVERRRDQLTW